MLCRLQRGQVEWGWLAGGCWAGRWVAAQGCKLLLQLGVARLQLQHLLVLVIDLLVDQFSQSLRAGEGLSDSAVAPRRKD